MLYKNYISETKGERNLDANNLYALAIADGQYFIFCVSMRFSSCISLRQHKQFHKSNVLITCDARVLMKFSRTTTTTKNGWLPSTLPANLDLWLQSGVSQPKPADIYIFNQFVSETYENVCFMLLAHASTRKGRAHAPVMAFYTKRIRQIVVYAICHGQSPSMAEHRVISTVTPSPDTQTHTSHTHMWTGHM